MEAGIKENFHTSDLNSFANKFAECIGNKLEKLCREMEEEMGLMRDSIFINEYASSNAVCLNEQEYPLEAGKKTVFNKSCIILNIKEAEEEAELIIKNEQFDRVPLPEKGRLKEVKDDSSRHIFFSSGEEGLEAYIREHIRAAVKNYKSGCKFGCCSKYKECSQAGSCLHENKLYATGCAYRSNLEQGKIFY